MTSHNTAQIKINNRRSIYRYILQNTQCSKMDVSSALNVSLPTVAHAISDLLSGGFIECCGVLDSTGGRKAAIYQSIPDARVAVGVQLLTDDVSIVVCDLRGEIIARRIIPIPFSDTSAYYKKVGNEIRSVVSDTASADKLLGVTIAVQGIVDKAHQQVVYGRIMNDSQITASRFEEYIGFPCILMHDSEAAAFAESYLNPDIKDSIYIFLNKNLGSGFIQNGKIYAGNNSRGPLVEHMCLVPQGKLCYCGKLGCAECYCSASSLMESAESDLPAFFVLLRSGNVSAQAIWTDYLNRLANTIYNVLMLQDVNIVIGGLVRNYITEEDLNQLFAMIEARSDFPIDKKSIVVEKIVETPAAVGAALFHISSFLEHF